jgi:signal transduction histidine kinase
MNMPQGWSNKDHNLFHELMYYAIIDTNGRIVSMNAAMNNEFGPAGKRPATYFQTLLEEKDQHAFETVLKSKKDIPPTVAVNVYSYLGAGMQTIIKWSFFHLISGACDEAKILCSGYKEQLENIQPAAQHNAMTELEKAQSEMLVKMLENERLLIGQELHDNVNQLLCTAKLHLDVMQVMREENILARQITQDLIMEAIEEIKKISRGMVVQQLKKETLLESVKAFVDDLRTVNKMNIVFGIHHFNEDQISESKKFNIYRIIQEQFGNIIQHSKSNTIVMTLETDDKNIELIIDDDGIGFDPDIYVQGIGLLNIRERVRMLDGKYEISTSPGNGCRLHIIIPI